MSEEATIADVINGLVREGWTLTHLINLDGECWQAHFNFEREYCVVATGESIEEAIANATLKTFDEANYGDIFRVSDHMLDEPRGVKFSKAYNEKRGRDLLARLGLGKPKLIRRPYVK